MKLKNDWWGYGELYGWAVMLEVVNEDRNGGDAVFYSFKTNDEFEVPFRNLERNDITFALRHFKTLPAQEQVLARAEFEKLRNAWPSVQAKRIADKNNAIELKEQDRASKNARLEQAARDAEIERKAKYEEAVLREQERRQKIKLDRAISAMTQLTENGVNHLWHFTSIDNLPLILSSGSLYGKSKNPNVNNVKFLSDDLSRKLDQSLRRDHFVRLSFIPNSWYFHRVCALHRLICWTVLGFPRLPFGGPPAAHHSAGMAQLIS